MTYGMYREWVHVIFLKLFGSLLSIARGTDHNLSSVFNLAGLVCRLIQR